MVSNPWCWFTFTAIFFAWCIFKTAPKLSFIFCFGLNLILLSQLTLFHEHQRDRKTKRLLGTLHWLACCSLQRHFSSIATQPCFSFKAVNARLNCVASWRAFWNKKRDRLRSQIEPLVNCRRSLLFEEWHFDWHNFKSLMFIHVYGHVLCLMLFKDCTKLSFIFALNSTWFN